MKKIMRKMILNMVVIFFAIISVPNVAEAASWAKNSVGWWWQEDDGSYPTNQWKTIQGKKYYFDQSGYMKTGWFWDGEDWYYLGATNDGAMKTGWCLISGKWYYMYENGTMASNTWIGSCWVDKDGAWVENQWIREGNRWWYRHADGSYTANDWEMIDGGWYHFDASGWMQTGWIQVQGKWYYLGSTDDGVMKANQWIGDYYVGADGAMLRNAWVGNYFVDENGKWDPSKRSCIGQHVMEKVYEDVDNGHYETVLVQEEYWKCTVCGEDISGYCNEHTLWAHSGVRAEWEKAYRTVEKKQWISKVEQVSMKSACKNCDYFEGHEHTWKVVYEKGKNGYACNGCSYDVSEYEDKYACHGGFHSHQWCEIPDYQECLDCGKKVHHHAWGWYEPEYYYNSDEIRRMGYYFCIRCFSFSTDGENIDNSIQSQCDNWVTPYDFSSNGGFVFETIYKAPMTEGAIQSIHIREGIRYCMTIGETSQLVTRMTPLTPTSDTTLKWSSSNPAAVTVSSTGKIRAVGLGEARITVETVNGRTDSFLVRVMETNIGKVTDAKVFIDGKEVVDGVVELSEIGEHEITLATNPKKAVYKVMYKIDSTSVVYMNRTNQAGNTSTYSWEKGISYTDPTLPFLTLKQGTAIMTVSISSLDGPMIEIPITIIVK